MTVENNRALIVFMKNPVAGKVKTRLAASIGDEKALSIYLQLLDINKANIKKINADIYWFINEAPHQDFKTYFFETKDNIILQEGENLGEKMSNAFQTLFGKGYNSIAIMGTDCPSLNNSIIDSAFDSIQDYDFCIGPAEDGGYYILAMNAFESTVFTDMQWSTESVLNKTLERVEKAGKTYVLLETLSDIDNEADARQADMI